MIQTSRPSPGTTCRLCNRDALIVHTHGAERWHIECARCGIRSAAHAHPVSCIGEWQRGKHTPITPRIAPAGALDAILLRMRTRLRGTHTRSAAA